MSVKPGKRLLDPGAAEMEALKAEVDAMIKMVSSIKSTLERVPTQLEKLTTGFHRAVAVCAQNYDLTDSDKPTSGIVKRILKVSTAKEVELQSSSQSSFKDKSFPMIQSWLGASCVECGLGVS
jgi:hypothetical protein